LKLAVPSELVISLFSTADGKMKRRIAVIAVALGTVLLIFNIAGLFAPIAEHPAASRKPVHKANLMRLSYQESLEALDRLDESMALRN
jgi:hypothetical protein